MTGKVEFEGFTPRDNSRGYSGIQNEIYSRRKGGEEIGYIVPMPKGLNTYLRMLFDEPTQVQNEKLRLIGITAAEMRAIKKTLNEGKVPDEMSVDEFNLKFLGYLKSRCLKYMEEHPEKARQFYCILDHISTNLELVQDSKGKR